MCIVAIDSCQRKDGNQKSEIASTSVRHGTAFFKF